MHMKQLFNKSQENQENEKSNKTKQIGLEVKLPGCEEFVPLGNFNKNIFNIYIKELEAFQESTLYKIFQICKYYNINFNDIIIRQTIKIEFVGDHNFNIDVNIGSLNGKLRGQQCNCILCKNNFTAIRSNIKICNAKHFCNCIDLYTGEIYKKEIQKWNVIYEDKNIMYLEGKTYNCKSHQVSANNMMTLYNHTNKMKNMDNKKRGDRSKETVKISRKPKFCKICNQITPHNGIYCLICKPESSGIAIQNFIEKDGLLFYFNEKEFIEWGKFKDKFKIQNINFKLPEEFKLYPTFRSQNSQIWGRSKSAFEQSLIDENIGWFVYIKFDENNKPLVIGKTGSKLVIEGTDVCFDLNEDGGPARKYLIEEGLNWNKTQIAICKCNSEKEALEKEKEIGKKYNLFYS